MYAAGLLLLLPLLAGCDLDWQEASAQRFEEALSAERQGDYERAREAYQAALAIDPYHPRANRNLAEILEKRFFETGLAIEYYERYLDLKPRNRRDVGLVTGLLDTLRAIRAGALEDPVDAMKDLLWAVQSGADGLVRDRLHSRFAGALRHRGIEVEAHIGTWKERFAGRDVRLTYREVNRAGETYASSVEVEVLENGALRGRWLYHFLTGERPVWRLVAEQPVRMGAR
jgi:tetratricopeptide (TPR) repeat protein